MRRRRAAVPAELATEIDAALAVVAEREGRLEEAVTDGAPRVQRRQAHAELRAAYLSADGLLREATRLARPHSYLEWSRWRHRLSQLDLRRQLHLFREADDTGVLGLGETRAVDTGMSGPAIGDLLHGRSRPAGAPARYGLDMEPTLAATETAGPARQAVPTQAASEPPTTGSDAPAPVELRVAATDASVAATRSDAPGPPTAA